MMRRIKSPHLILVEGECLLLQQKILAYPEEARESVLLDARPAGSDDFAVHLRAALSDGRRTDTRVGRGVGRAGAGGLVKLEGGLIADGEERAWVEVCLLFCVAALGRLGGGTGRS